MDKILEKLKLTVDNPGIYKPLTPEESAELFLYFLQPKPKLFKKPKVIQGIDGVTPEPDKDYISKETALKFLADVKAELEAKNTELEKAIQSKLATIKNGEDAKITDDIIATIASVASSLVELPDFDILITKSSEAVRDALELLVDDDRLDKTAIKGLDDYEEVARLAKKRDSARETNFGQVVRDIVAGDGITIDKDDPNRPVLSATLINPTPTIANAPYAIVSDEATTNLIPNPKFEVNITDGWVSTGTVTRTRDTSEKWYGSASMKLVTTAVESGSTTSSITVEASSTYVFSFYVKGAVGGESLWVTLTPNVGTAVNSVDTLFGTGTFSTTTPVTTNWQRMRLAITTNGSASSLTCAIRSVTAGSQTVYIDGVQLEKKTLPAGSTNTYFPTSYCDGSMGNGYTWNGTADNSSSSRTSGTHFLAPIADNGAGSFVQRSDGSIDRMYFRADESFSNAALSGDAPQFPFQFIGKAITNLITSGIKSGIAFVENLANGTALYVKSAATTAYGMVIEGGSITSGTILSIFAPADLSTMISSGGKFFEFADKNQNSSYQWTPVFAQNGVFTLPHMTRATFAGGGGQTTTDRTGLSGTVGATNGTTAVTGAGTAFLTDYRRGDTIQIETAGVYTAYNIASITSDTALTLTGNYGEATALGKAHKGRARQWRPANLQLAGAYGDHNYAFTSPQGDFVYNVYPNGSEGQLHVMKSSARMDLTNPTENAGDALVTKKFVDTTTRSISASASETDVITGYTVPANMLTTGKILRIRFGGDFTALATTTTLIWRVKLGSTTILTGRTRAVNLANAMDFMGDIDIIGTSLQAQKSNIRVTGDNTNLTSSVMYNEHRYGTSTVDCRVDNTLTVTAQFDDASSMDMEYAYIELI